MTSTALARPQMNMGALSDPENLGRLLASSGYFEDTKDAAQAVVKVLAGQELGFGPIASMTGVYIVKGRVTLSANLMAAAIKRWRPRYDFRLQDLSNDHAIIAFYEEGTEVGTSEFTMADAAKAGLTGSQTWQKFPRNMLFARAMSNGAKFYCPDVFSGSPVYTPDELGAEIDPETGELHRVDAVPSAAPPRMDTVEVVEAAPAPEPEVNPPTSEPAGTEESAAPTPAPSTAAVAEEDPDSIVTAEEVATLTELLDTVKAPDSFRRMALMTYGADDLASLTRGQAREVAAKATARFGG